MDSRVVIGPWSALLSRHLGHDVVLAQVLRPEGAIDIAPTTLVPHASVRRVEHQLSGQRYPAFKSRSRRRSASTLGSSDRARSGSATVSSSFNEQRELRHRCRVG